MSEFFRAARTNGRRGLARAIVTNGSRERSIISSDVMNFLRRRSPRFVDHVAILFFPLSTTLGVHSSLHAFIPFRPEARDRYRRCLNRRIIDGILIVRADRREIYLGHVIIIRISHI